MISLNESLTTKMSRMMVNFGYGQISPDSSDNQHMSHVGLYWLLNDIVNYQLLRVLVVPLEALELMIRYSPPRCSLTALIIL